MLVRRPPTLACLLGLLFLLAACGEGPAPGDEESSLPPPDTERPEPEPREEPGPPEQEPEPEQGAETDPDPEPHSDADTDPTPSDSDPDRPFDDLLAEIAGLRDAADFNQAYLLCMKHRGDYPPAQNRRLIELGRDLRDYKGRAAEVEVALDQLAQGNATTRRIAYRQLLSYGRATVIILRNRLPSAEGRKAVYMADILAQFGDRASFDAIVATYRATEDEDDAAAILDALERLLPECGPEQLGSLFADIVVGKETGHFPLADIFFAARGEGLDLSERTGHPNAEDQLKAYVIAANESDQTRVQLWAREHADFAGLSIPGWQWEIWTNRELKGEPDQVRHTEEIAYGDKKAFPLDEDFSCRWTGDLAVTEAGTHVFSATSDDGNRVWLNGELIIDDWSMHGMEETTAELELQPGKHALKIEYMQGGGGAGMYFRWVPPGAEEKRILDKEHVSTLPFEERK